MRQLTKERIAELREHCVYMQEHYSDPADRENMEIFCDMEKVICAIEMQIDKPRIKPHKYGECVDMLLENAIAYAGSQQLRERLSSALSLFVSPDHAHTRNGGV